VVQEDICNGCGYCVPACPFGVIDRRVGDKATKNVGLAQKCTLCYDQLEVGKTPACAQACPTESIQFGDVEELRQRAKRRRDSPHAAGVPQARLYGADPDDGVGGTGAMFLLLDQPEVHGLPRDPVVTTRDLLDMWKKSRPRRRGPCRGCHRLLPRRPLMTPNQRPRRPHAGPRPTGSEVPDSAAHKLPTAAKAREDRGWPRRRGGGRNRERQMVPDAHFTSYYGRPVVKAAPWSNDIPAYLFLGGLAAGSTMLGAGGDLTGRPSLRRTGRVGGMVAISLSFAALVHDLGRPARFVNMLRVAKPTSPMSVGTWIHRVRSPGRVGRRR